VRTGKSGDRVLSGWELGDDGLLTEWRRDADGVEHNVERSGDRVLSGC